MTERDKAGGGGLTGATGDLTFEENDRPLVTGEAREISDGGRHADVTAAQIRRSPAEQARGLNPDDPAYRMDRHPSSGELGGDPSREETGASAETRIGGDEITDREEHL